MSSAHIATLFTNSAGQPPYPPPPSALDPNLPSFPISYADYRQLAREFIALYAFDKPFEHFDARRNSEGFRVASEREVREYRFLLGVCIDFDRTAAATFFEGNSAAEG